MTDWTLYRLSPTGSIEDQNRATVHLGGAPWGRRPEGIILPWALPAPILAFFLQPIAIVQADRASTYRDAIHTEFEEAWPGLVAVSLLAIGLAMIAWRRGRRFGLTISERWGWSVFVLLLGVPGFAGFLLHRRWPPLEACPHCHEMTAIGGGFCARCRVRQPGPKLTGIEVFA